MKITVVSSYFPTSARPYSGNSAFQTLLRMKEHVSIEVVAPLERYPDIRGLKPARYERSDPKWKPPEFQTTYVEYPALPLLTRPFNGRTCTTLLLPHVRRTRPDLILNYWLYPDGYAAVRIGKILGVPVVVGAIGSDLRFRNDPITIRMVRQTMIQAAAVLTVSEELRQQAISRGVAPEKVTAIRNGCDTAIFHPGDRLAARAALGCQPQDELVVYAGNLLVTKGLGELAAAGIELAKTRPRLRVAIVGQGPFGEELRQIASSAGMTDRFLLPGRCDARGIAQWMCAADVFCLPSYSEGCPNVVVEALACGRPVVASNVGGIPELVNESCGILIAPRDPEKLREALDSGLARTWDAEEISRASTRSWATVAAETLAVCHRAICRPH